MRTVPDVAALAPLLQYLDGLSARATVSELRRLMERLDITLDDVAEFVRFGDDRYLRNLICEGKWYHILAICWRSGQRSPIHNHANSVCGLKVLTGIATETRFATTPCGQVKAVSSNDMRSGQLVVSHDADIHQVSNPQEPDTDLVTLHVYSPPLLRMDTYSLTDATIGEFRPTVLECASGGGI